LHADRTSSSAFPTPLHHPDPLCTDGCAARYKKQQRYPVFFLSGCGLYPHADPRRTSIPAALAFAEALHLAGVVLPVEVRQH
jgi:hypothetical protein